VVKLKGVRCRFWRKGKINLILEKYTVVLVVACMCPSLCSDAGIYKSCQSALICYV